MLTRRAYRCIFSSRREHIGWLMVHLTSPFIHYSEVQVPAARWQAGWWWFRALPSILALLISRTVLQSWVQMHKGHQERTLRLVTLHVDMSQDCKGQRRAQALLWVHSQGTGWRVQGRSRLDINCRARQTPHPGQTSGVFCPCTV